MKQFSLKRLALSAVALLTVGVASAAVENVTVTYDFTGETNNATPINQTGGNEITVNSVSMWKLALDGKNFDNRFAVGPIDRTGTNGFYFKNYNSEKGLYSQYDNRNFAVLNLKAGDQVTINFTIAGDGGTFTFVGTPNLTGIAANAAVASGTTYTVSSDGNLMMITGKASADPKVYITLVSIKTAGVLGKNYSGDDFVGALPGETYADDYSISAGGVTMTLGANGAWTRANYTTTWGNFDVTFSQTAQGDSKPTNSSSRCNDENKKVPTAGEYYTFEPIYSGKLRVYGQFQWQCYLSNSDASSWQKVDVGNSATWTHVDFNVVAGIKYWFWNDNNKPKVCGFAFTPDFGVKIKDGAYATFGNASAHNFEVPTGLTAYAVEHESKDTEVSLKKVDYINAGQAVMISGSAGSYAFGTTASTDDANFANNKLVAIASDTKIRTDATYKYYVYGKKGTYPVGFYPVSSTSDYTAKAGKAYLRIAATDAPAAPMLWLNFEDDQTTGVNEVRSKMEDGRGIYYNLAGQRVDNPTKGIYIVNGQKVVIK